MVILGYRVTCLNGKGHHVSGQEYNCDTYNNYKKRKN